MRGFELGADDYLTKPFATEVLVARINAVVRRTQAVPEETTGVYQVGERRPRSLLIIAVSITNVVASVGMPRFLGIACR